MVKAAPKTKLQNATDAAAAPRISPLGHPLAANGLAFLTGLCVMVLELVAGRLVARHLGASLHTWTSVIGIVLTGLSAGNWLGGRLADRFRAEQLLGKLFMASSVSSLAILWLTEIMAGAFPESGVSWPVRIVCFVTVVFAWPALALGTITPVLAKGAVERAAARGRAIGNIYAAGTVGSIVGTFLTGFVLVAWLGTKAIVLCVAGTLAFAGLLCGGFGLAGGAWAVLSALACFFGLAPFEWAEIAGVALVLREPPDVIFADDSHYFFITVNPDRDNPHLRVLQLDALVHGSLDPNRPGVLSHYGYEQTYAAVTARFMHGRSRLRTLFIGGGAYVFPRYLQVHHPISDIEVVEIDPAVTEVCHRSLGLPRDTTIRSIHEDARTYVAALSPGDRYDVIYGDAFNDFSVPWHLTTREFNEQLSGLLAPDGVYMMNLVDILNSGRFLAAFVHTARQTFPHVTAIATDALPGVDTGAERNAFVVVCSKQPLVLDTPPLGSGPGESMFRGQILSKQVVDDLMRRARPPELTDDYAPVDNLLVPVIRNRGTLTQRQ
jgi:predicted membrane-bound spermidine synthase